MAVIKCRVCNTKVRFDLAATPDGQVPICPRCKTPLRAMTAEADHRRVEDEAPKPGAGSTGLLLELRDTGRYISSRDLRGLAKKLGPIRRALKACAPFDPRRKFQAEVTSFTEGLLGIGVNDWHNSVEHGRPGEAFVEKVFEDITGILPQFQDPGHGTVGALLRMLELASTIPQSHYRRLCVIMIDCLIRLPHEGREDGTQDALEKMLDGEFTNDHVRSELIRAMGWIGYPQAIRKLLSPEGRQHPEHLFLSIYLLGPRALSHLSRMATDNPGGLEKLLEGMPFRSRSDDDWALDPAWLANPDRIDLGAVELARLACFFGGKFSHPFLQWLDSVYALPGKVMDQALSATGKRRFAREVFSAGVNRRFPECSLFEEDWSKWCHNTSACRSLKNSLDTMEIEREWMNIVDREEVSSVLKSLGSEVHSGFLPMIEKVEKAFTVEVKPVILGCLGCGTRVRVKPDSIPLGKQPICPKCSKSLSLSENFQAPPESAVRQAAQARVVEGMILIPDGLSIFGCDRLGRGRDPWERPQHEVRMHSFLIDQYPVTNEDYRKFKPDHAFAPGKGRHPVVQITLAEAEAYAKWTGKRLPTELEWERAARGSDDRTYPWGDTFHENRANTAETGKFATTAIDAFPDGASPFGVMDMVGNVWEWTSSWYVSYMGAKRPFDYTGQQVVVRGGTCFEDQSRNRVTRRHYLPPGTRNATLGFRCVKNAR